MNNHNRRSTDGGLRVRVICLLALLPVAFVGGRYTGGVESGVQTVRQVEATPQPRALPAGISRFHDASEEVTCYQVSGAPSISCLPDQWLASARVGGQP